MKKHIPLIVGISLPVLFIIIMSIVIFAPSLFVKPQYNFIYSNFNESFYPYNFYKNTFEVKGNHIVLKAIPENPNRTSVGDIPTLYLYDVKASSSHQITLDEAKGYSVDAGPSSPDGYTVQYEYNYNRGFFPFGGGGSDSGYFVEKDGVKKKLSGLSGNNGYPYEGGLKVVGWIK